jgi:hypothetical protein
MQKMPDQLISGIKKVTQATSFFRGRFFGEPAANEKTDDEEWKLTLTTNRNLMDLNL